MKHFLLATVAVIALLFPARPATANVFVVADYNRFHEFKSERVGPLGLELSSLIMHPPWPRGAPEVALTASVRTQDCMIQLSGSYGEFEATLDHTADLVGLASKMVDTADELFVILVLKIHATYFMENLKLFQVALDATLAKCSQDGATVAKGQEISRIYRDAGSLIQSVVIAKIGALPKQ
jgi:hypothetical protein